MLLVGAILLVARVLHLGVLVARSLLTCRHPSSAFDNAESLLPAVLISVLLTLGLVLVELDRMGITELQPTIGGGDVEAAGQGT